MPIYVIPFGVDVTRFVPRPPPVAGEPVVLGFVKHLLPKYGPDVLLEAFAQIHQQRPNTRLLMVGRGSMLASLVKRMGELGLEKVVNIPGRIAYEKIPDLIRGLDLMVMPSIYDSETFGVAAIEASASGVPVVASRVGGLPEAVVHGRTGLLVEPRNVGRLGRGVHRIDRRPGGGGRLCGLAGRRLVERYLRMAR